MSQGIKVWDAAGQLILDVTDRLARYHSTIVLSSIAPRTSGTFSVPGYALDGTWFFFIRNTSIAGCLNIYEISGGFYVFNESYYSAYGSGVTIDIFRG